MPNPSTVHSFGTTTTSTAVTSVNQTGEAMFGRPFVVRHQYGELVFQPQTVLTANSSATVHMVSFTPSRPTY